MGGQDSLTSHTVMPGTVKGELHHEGRAGRFGQVLEGEDKERRSRKDDGDDNKGRGGGDEVGGVTDPLFAGCIRRG